jgi:hypothetical protein
MKKWIKLTKYYQGGSLTDYKFVDSSEIETEELQDYFMEKWGENTNGGHAYGYRVYLDELNENETPPKEWLEKQIIEAKETLKSIKKEKRITKKERIKNQKELVLFFENLL